MKVNVVVVNSLGPGRYAGVEFVVKSKAPKAEILSRAPITLRRQYSPGITTSCIHHPSVEKGVTALTPPPYPQLHLDTAHSHRIVIITLTLR